MGIKNLYLNNIVTDGLVLHVDPTNDAFHPNPGTDLADPTKSWSFWNADTATPITYNSPNQSYYFTNDVSLKNIVTNQSFAFTSDTNSITWDFWINIPTNYVSGLKTLFYDRSQGIQPFTWIWISTTSLRIQFAQETNYMSITTESLASYLLDKWLNLTIAMYFNFDSSLSEITIYTNGNYFSSYTNFKAKFPNLITTKTLGCYGNAAHVMNGYIGPIKIYNRVLSLEEIKQNYTATSARFKSVKPLRIGNIVMNMFNENSYKLIEDGLIQHLDAANSNSYPGDGSIWYNLKSTNNGTIQTDLVFDPSYGGNFVFNGNDKIQFTSTLNGDTLSFWFKTISAAEQVIIGGIYTSSVYSVQLRNNKLGTRGMETIRNNFNDGIWHNATFINTGLASPDTYQIYVDGKIERIQTGGPDRVCSPEKIVGCRLYQSTYEYYFNGSLANILSYNRILTPSEIKINYLSLKDRFR